MPSAGARPSTAQTKAWPGLAATLATLDDAQLTRLLTLRPELSAPAPRDWASLASRAGAWPSARDSYRDLDRAGQRVVEALCLLTEPVALGDLAALLGVAVDDPDLTAALVRVEDRGLAFLSGGTRPDVHLLPALKQVDYPAGLGPPLASILQNLTGPALEQLAVRIGAKPTRNMIETRAIVTGVLSDPAEVVRLLLQAPDGAADLARRAAFEHPLVGVSGGLYGLTDRSPAGWMVNRGLLAIADYYHGVMPREPAIALRSGQVFAPDSLRRPGANLTAVDANAVDAGGAERAMRVVTDVAAVLDQWSVEPAPVLKAGGLGIREVRKAAKAADLGEIEVAHVIELAVVAGLVRVDGGGEALPTMAYDDWLALEAPARWTWLATSWLDAEIHISLAGATGANEKPIPPLLDRSPERLATRRRQIVLRVLQEGGPGQALDATSVRDRVDWESPATWAGGPANPPMLVSWALAEADLLGVTAWGSLSTAGRALLDGRPADATSALAALVPPAVTQFVIQADLTAVIAGEPAPSVRTELDLLGDVESKGAATVYRFSEGSVRRAFDAGRTGADIVAFLERHATRGVPQPLAYLVADLDRRFGNVRVGAVTTYLRSDDTALLAEVRQARATTKLRLRSLAPTVLVTDVDSSAVMATLQAAGFLPAPETSDGALLLTRPPVRRAAARPAQAWRVPTPPDPATVVAALRRGPIVQAQPTVAPPLPLPTWPDADLIGAIRPTEIAKGPRAVRAALGLACDEYWLVRISYVGTDGRALEHTVEPTDLDGRQLYADCLPDGAERRFVLDRIEWARVLTEAEELLVG